MSLGKGKAGVLWVPSVAPLTRGPGREPHIPDTAWRGPVSPCGPVGPWAASHQEGLVAQALVLGETSYCSQQLCRSWL